jgi:hypothetical protein
MESFYDGPPPTNSPENTNDKPCFPVTRESIDTVTREIQTKFNGDMGRFVDAESVEIGKDKRLKEFLDIASGWHEELEGDRAPFLDGAAFVHRVLREQGAVPPMQDDPSEALRKEEDEYKKIAEASPDMIATDVLTRVDRLGFSRIKELSGSDQELGTTLKKMTEEHPQKPSFALGAELTYSVLKNADKQMKALYSGLDDELASITEGK